MGDMDSFYLNNAVYRLEDFLKTAKPECGCPIVFGRREGHCWSGPLSRPDRMRAIAEYVAARAPKG